MPHPPRAARRGPLAAAGRLGLLALAVVLVAGGCRLARSAPSSNPADFPGVRRVLDVAGIPTVATVSGDAGCADRELARAAISFQASGLDQASPVRAYFFNFDDEEALQRNLGRVATCASEWVTDPTAFVEIVAAPYVVTSQGPWAPEFERAFTAALREAADQVR